VASAIARLRADVLFAVIDAMLIVMAYTTAMFFRFMDEGVIPNDWFGSYFSVLPVIVFIHLLANVLFGAYGHVWEYASVGEALRVVGASISASAVMLFGLFLVRVNGGGRLVPGSVLLMGAMLTLGGMGAVRFRSRMFSLRRLAKPAERPLRTLIVGVGRTAADLARYGAAAKGSTRVIGFIDPSDSQHSPRRLAGLPVLGSVVDIASIVESTKADEVLIAAPHADELSRLVVDLCMNIDVRFRIVPELDSVLAESSGFRDVRDLRLDDLLPRSTVQTDLGNVAAMLAGKRVLVTGAGGSIGSEIVRQILGLQPDLVVALDNDETHLHDGNLTWSAMGGQVCIALADIRDAPAVNQIFETYRPEVVFHAAASKHVPILERFPHEALKTNVAGTHNVITAGKKNQVERFVLISTDKAVNPASIMGATKRVAEMLTQAYAATSANGIFCAVRFGNVLGSRGSVVPTFMEQIAHGGPVTVTELDMERYFMTIDEAVQLVLQASALSSGGEVFVLDMGAPMRIVDLAHRLIRLAGLVPGRDIKVVTIGVREGEKIKEVLSLTPLEESSHPQVRVARPSHPGVITLIDAIEHLGKLAEDASNEHVRDTLLALTTKEWSAEELIDLSEFDLELSATDRSARR
jgi:FlaA1/EpsC-like NDP-sugar epimerase